MNVLKSELSGDSRGQLQAGEVLSGILSEELIDIARFQFVTETEAVVNFIQKLAAVEEVSFTYSELEAAMYRKYEKLIDSVRSQIVARHEQQLRSFSQILVNADEGRWEKVASHHDEFRGFEGVLSADTINNLLEGTGLYQPVWGFEGITKLSDSVAAEFQNMPEDIEIAQIYENGVIKFKCTECSHLHTLDLKDVFLENPPDKKRVARGLNKILLEISKFEDDPAEYVADEIFQRDSPGSAKLLEQEFNQLIAKRNQSLVERYRPANKIKPKYVKKQKDKTPTPAPLPESPSRSQAHVEREVKANLVVQVPWEKQSRKTEVEFTLNGTRSVGLVSAIPESLLPMSLTSRAKFTENSDGVHRFDEISATEARRVFEGILPYENTNNVRRVKLDKTKGILGDIPIWYTFEISNNAPRVYFTLLDAEALILGELPKGVGGDTKCVVVVAETDKANQMEVLKQLTGRRRSYLKAGGVGSV